MRVSIGLASLVAAIAFSTLGAAGPADEPSGPWPPGPAIVDLTPESMIFGPDEKHRAPNGKLVYGSIKSAVFSPDGKTLVTGDHLGRVNVYDPATGRRLVGFRSSDPNESRCDTLAISPDGRTIAVPAQTRGHIATMDPVSGRVVREMQALLDPPPRATPEGLAFAPGGKLLAGGMDRGGETLLWDADSGRLLQVIPPQMWPAHGGQDVPATVRGLAFSPDGSTLYISGYRLLAWDVAGERARPTRWPADAYAGHLVISRDRTRLAVIGAFQGRGRASNEIAVADATTGQLLCSVAEDGYEIIEAAFSPDGRTIATLVWYLEGSDPQTYRFVLRLRDAATLRPVAAAWFGRGICFTSVAFSPDGRTIAVGGSLNDRTAIGMARWDGARIGPWRKDP